MNKLGSYQQIVGAEAEHAAEEERARLAHAQACRDTLRQLKERHKDAAAASPPAPNIDAEIAAGVAVLALSAEPFSTVQMIRRARGKPCPYCGGMMIGGRGNSRASRDHIRSRVNGGKLRPGNVLVVCQQCNGDKNTRSLPEWLHFLRRDGDERADLVEALIETLRRIGKTRVIPEGWPPLPPSSRRKRWSYPRAEPADVA